MQDVAIARHGTSLEVRYEGGQTELVRWIDLSPLLGEPCPRTSRFERAELRGGELWVQLAGGDGFAIPKDAIAPRPAEDRSIELVVETTGVLLTCDEGSGPLGQVTGGAVLIAGGRVMWAGPIDAAEGAGFDLTSATRLSVGDRLLSPGLIDCHAHPVFAGDRAAEFAMRAAGRSYLEIAASGGGIVATVAATRAASFEDLLALASARLDRALSSGTTTMEAKSGYDLTVDGELRMLEVARALDALHPVDLEPTLLGAHALPLHVEAAADREAYVRAVVEQMIPQAAARDLCRAVDVYCDVGAFTLDETRAILGAARTAGLELRAHVGQFADQGAAELLAELGGLSVDHVEQISQAGIDAIATSSVVAVMLPSACVQLRLAPPPVAALRSAGVALAVASDLNPGSSHTGSLPLQMWLATTHFGMTVEEAWLGVTRHAARALGRTDLGWLGAGAVADLVAWDARSPADIPYRVTDANVHRVVKRGRLVPTPRRDI